VHAHAGDVLRGASSMPCAVQRCIACVQADGGVDRPTGARGDQRRVERGGALGLDRHQPGPRSRTTRQAPPQPDPPSPADAARIVDGAFAVDDDWGTLVWLVMTTGMRRGEVCALRWSRVDLDVGVVDVRRSYRLRHGVGVEKDTKTHQMRRIALDSETVALLTEHKRRCAARLRLLGGELTENM